MRTGAIFARGSCRALKWMALAGMVLALGAGQAAAQITVDSPPTSLTEGKATTIKVDFVGQIAASSPNASTVVLNATATNAVVIGGVMQVPVPANPGGSATPFATVSRTFTVTPNEDDDAAANNPAVTVSFTLGGAGRLRTTADADAAVSAPGDMSDLAVTDDETQGFVLELLTRDENLVEGKSIEYRVKSEPLFVAGSTETTVELSLTPALTISGNIVSGSNSTKGQAQVLFNADNATRLISFTVPKDGNNEDTQTTLTAFWGTIRDRGEDTDSRTIRDTDPVPLTFTPASQADIIVNAGVAMTAVTLPMASGGTMPYTYGMSPALPAGLTFDPATRMISGTPTTAAAAATFTYTVTDSAATSATRSLTFDITVVAPAPGTLTFTPASQADISVEAGMAMTPMQLPTATGGAAPYTYTATGLPAGLSVASATGMLSGTPTTVAPAATVTYTATDSATPAGTGQLTFAITVTEPGVAPKTTTEIQSAINDALMAADSDGDGKWTEEDEPAAVALTAVFNNLPETFAAEASSSHPSIVQASILSSSGLMRASNPALALTPLSAGTASVTVTAAGSQAVLPPITVLPRSVTGTSRRALRYVTVGALREGGQAEATVVLTGPVESGAVFKAKLRLVGQTHTRENGIAAALASPNPHRVVSGVRVPITGELTATDYDANVIGELTIQPGYSSGSVTIYTGTDADAEDERLVLQVIKDGSTFDPSSDLAPRGGVERVFMVEDSHEQGYVLTAVPSKIYEAGRFTTSSILHFTPNYVREDVPVFVTLTSSHSAYSALFVTTGTSSRQLPTGGEGVRAEFRLVPERRAGCNCDGNREDEEVVVTATVGGQVVAETTIAVVDVHKLPEITVTAMTAQGVGPLTVLEEGSKYKVRVEANRNKPSGEVTGETVAVSLALGDDSTASAEDYRITPSSRSITGGLNDQSATFDLEVLAGDGDIGDETLVLNAVVRAGRTNGGGSEEKGMLSVTLTDTTTLNVEPRSDVEVELAVATARNVADGADDLWTYGDDDLSLKLSDLFKLPADGFTVTADAESADPKVVTAEADAGIVTVTAVGMGATTVTVTATSAASGAQISPNIASVEFKIEVDELTRVYMVSGPDDMNLAEGGAGGRVTVSTNVPVTENTEVMLMRDGSSSAGDDDYTLDPPLVTIMAGEMSGSTMVMATEDNMAEEMEMLTLFLVVDGTQMTDKSVSFYLWDAAVPALPVIAQLLLAALLAIGGCRRYLRR